MKTRIIIHVLPFEIDRFEHQLFELRKNSKFLDKDDHVIIDATLNVNDLTVHWDQSKLDKQYFIDRFNTMKDVCSWTETYFDVNSDNTCLGINDKRRTSIRNHASTCDNFIYLDNDMFYPNTTLKYVMDTAKSVKNKYYVVSPQTGKMWDNSWDMLANDYYKKLQETNLRNIDPFEVYTMDYGEIEAEALNTFKMGGGWFNMLSSNLLTYIGVPDSFGPYGVDDTFMMDACKIMKGFGYDVCQYIVKNLVATQCYKYESLVNVYKGYVSFNIHRKQEFAANAMQSYQQEINNFIERCKNDIIHNTNQK